MTRRKPPFGKTARVLVKNARGQGKRLVFWRKMRRGKENAARFDGKCAEARKTPRVVTENASGQGKRLAFWRKMRQGKENAARFGGKCVGTRKTARVLVKNARGQGKRLAFWRKMRVDVENGWRLDGKSVWARKTARVLAENACGWEKPDWVEAAFTLGKRHPGGFLKKMRRDEKNLFGWSPLSRWGSSTRAGFDGKCAGALSRVFAVDFLNLVKEFRAAFSASTLRAEDF